jgi:hypothetical protein
MHNGKLLLVRHAPRNATRRRPVWSGDAVRERVLRRAGEHQRGPAGAACVARKRPDRVRSLRRYRRDRATLHVRAHAMQCRLHRDQSSVHGQRDVRSPGGAGLQQPRVMFRHVRCRSESCRWWRRRRPRCCVPAQQRLQHWAHVWTGRHVHRRRRCRRLVRSRGVVHPGRRMRPGDPDVQGPRLRRPRRRLQRNGRAVPGGLLRRRVLERLRAPVRHMSGRHSGWPALPDFRSRNVRHVRDLRSSGHRRGMLLRRRNGRGRRRSGDLQRRQHRCAPHPTEHVRVRRSEHVQLTPIGHTTGPVAEPRVSRFARPKGAESTLRSAVG